jgi:hypothetical protein
VSEEGLAAFVNRLETNEALREAFLNLVLTGHPNLLQSLQNLVAPGDEDGDSNEG